MSADARRRQLRRTLADGLLYRPSTLGCRSCDLRALEAADELVIVTRAHARIALAVSALSPGVPGPARLLEWAWPDRLELERAADLHRPGPIGTRSRVWVGLRSAIEDLDVRLAYRRGQRAALRAFDQLVPCQCPAGEIASGACRRHPVMTGRLR